ncbi:MAG: disulfide bond formation protein B [Devosia sp.]
MTSATHDAPMTSGGWLTDRGRLLAGLAFLLGLAAILGAWGSELFGGLVPCELCLEQRLAYYWGLPVLALVLILWNRLPRAALLAGLLVAAAIFAWGTYMGTYHAGVEWRFWPGPTACTGTGGDVSFSDLTNLNAAPRVVPCDVVQFRFLGLSLAGYNALVSIAIVVALLASAGLVRNARASSR